MDIVCAQLKRDHQLETSVLEERLSEANRQLMNLEMRHSVKGDDDGATAPHAAVGSFEIGFGSTEQAMLLNTMSLHAEQLADIVCSLPSIPPAPSAQNLPLQARLVSRYLLSRGHHFGSQLEQQLLSSTATLHCAIVSAALTVASAAHNIPYGQLHHDLHVMSAFARREFTSPEDAREIDSTAQHLQSQIFRVLYLAGMQLMHPSGSDHARVSAVVSGQLKSAHHKIMNELVDQLGINDEQQKSACARCLSDLAATALQVVLLCLSLRGTRRDCKVFCASHVGKTWDPITMEPAVKEIPVAGLTKRVVLACVRPSLQFTPAVQPTSTDDVEGLEAGVLVKAQVVTMVPAPILVPTPAPPIPTLKHIPIPASTFNLKLPQPSVQLRLLRPQLPAQCPPPRTGSVQPTPGKQETRLQQQAIAPAADWVSQWLPSPVAHGQRPTTITTKRSCKEGASIQASAATAQNRQNGVRSCLRSDGTIVHRSIASEHKEGVMNGDGV